MKNEVTILFQGMLVHLNSILQLHHYFSLKVQLLLYNFLLNQNISLTLYNKPLHSAALNSTTLGIIQKKLNQTLKQ